MHNRNVLITGASGFIGGALVTKLIQNSSNQVTASDVINKINNIEEANFVDLNISDLNDIAIVCNKYNPDIIIHCAGIAHQKIGSIDSEEYQRVNSHATENFAKAANKVNPDVHFIFLSSISVYGEDKIICSVSEVSECKPSSDYASSKLDAEKRLKNLYDTGKLKKLDILRLAPVYDSGWSLNLDRRVFAPKKTAYLRFGSGYQVMSAISRQNLVDFIEYLINHSERFGDRYCNVYNVCDEKSYSFNHIIETFKRSRYHPDRFVLTVPLSMVWLLTRMAGFVFKNKRQWIYSCYDKLANDFVFDNSRMLAKGFKPKHTLESVFLKEKI